MRDSTPLNSMGGSSIGEFWQFPMAADLAYDLPVL